MIICTFIYAEIEGTKEMKRSIERQGHELAIIPVHTTSPDAINQEMYNFYQRAKTGHKKFVYTDSADTYLQRPILEDEIPDNKIIYSTEKNCYPYPDWKEKHPATTSPFRFLNGGGVCGSIEVMLNFHAKYRLASVGGMNGQAYLQQCLFKGLVDKFPIELDDQCKIFQTVAFTNDTELGWNEDGLLYNKLFNTVPALLHGNGRTDMTHIYDKLNKKYEPT